MSAGGGVLQNSDDWGITLQGNTGFDFTTNQYTLSRYNYSMTYVGSLETTSQVASQNILESKSASVGPSYPTYQMGWLDTMATGGVCQGTQRCGGSLIPWLDWR